MTKGIVLSLTGSSLNDQIREVSPWGFHSRAGQRGETPRCSSQKPQARGHCADPSQTVSLVEERKPR
jgi:hypothetical protein